jgi:orotate phosphoribosyltransferase
LSDRDQLRTLLRERSVRTGEFTLASGARSTYYIDARLTTMSGAGQALIGRVGLAALAEAGWAPDLVGGLTLGADPVSYALAHAAHSNSLTLDAFTVRKEAKDHGAGRLIEGPFSRSAAVVIVEDVVTSGGSALRAAQSVRSAGGNILGVFAIVDREQGGRHALADSGLELIARFTASELLDR